MCPKDTSQLDECRKAASTPILTAKRHHQQHVMMVASITDVNMRDQAHYFVHVLFDRTANLKIGKIHNNVLLAFYHI